MLTYKGDALINLFHSNLPPAVQNSLEVHLVRHGQAHNDDGVDTHGPELTALGLRQARSLGKRLAHHKYAAIYSSDLTRARQTADAIACHHPDDILTVTRDLREICGSHSTLGMSQLITHSDRSLIEEQESMHRFIDKLRSTHSENDSVLVVCHGNIIRGLIPLMGGIESNHTPLVEIYNCALSIINIWSNGRAVVRLLNCVSHLPQKYIT